MKANHFPESFERDENFEKDYREIFSVLENFIDLHTNKPVSWPGIFLDKVFITSIAIPILPLFYLSIIVVLKDLIQQNFWLIYFISAIFLAFIGFILYIFIKQIVDEIRELKDISKKLIRRTSNQGLSDIQLSKQLTRFGKPALKYAEKRLKLLIENRKISTNKLTNLVPLLALFIATFTIYSSGIHNLIIPNIMLVSGVFIILLKGFTEFLDNPELYQRCLSIIEYAQVLAEETQEVEQTSLPNTEPSNINLMETLRKHKIDQPSDFDHNL